MIPRAFDPRRWSARTSAWRRDASSLANATWWGDQRRRRSERAHGTVPSCDGDALSFADKELAQGLGHAGRKAARHETRRRDRHPPPRRRPAPDVERRYDLQIGASGRCQCSGVMRQSDPGNPITFRAPNCALNWTDKTSCPLVSLRRDAISMMPHVRWCRPQGRARHQRSAPEIPLTRHGVAAQRRPRTEA